MNKNGATRSDLVCLKCGNVDFVYRRPCKLKCSGHIKDLWCYKCCLVTKHYEVRDVSKFIFKYEDKECVDEDVRKVLVLLNGDMNGNERVGVSKKVLKRE